MISLLICQKIDYFAQACRGEEREEEASTSIDMGKGSNTPEETDKDKIDFSTDEDEFVDYEDGVKTVTPAGADFLVCYSTAEGRVDEYWACDTKKNNNNIAK